MVACHPRLTGGAGFGTYHRPSLRQDFGVARGSIFFALHRGEIKHYSTTDNCSMDVTVFQYTVTGRTPNGGIIKNALRRFFVGGMTVLLTKI